MKKRFPHRKIGIIVKCANYGLIACFVLAVVCAFIFSLLCEDKRGQVVGGFNVFIVSWIVFGLIDLFTCRALLKRELRHHKQYVRLKVPQSSFVEFLAETKPLQVTDRTYVFVYDERMFNTVAVYFLDKSMNVSQLKSLRHKTNLYFRENYPVARVTNTRKRHHELKAQLYVTNELVTEMVSQLTSRWEEGYTMGLVRGYWCVNDNSVYIPFYRESGFKLSSLRNYDKMLEKISLLFNCTDIDEVDFEMNDINK